MPVHGLTPSGRALLLLMASLAVVGAVRAQVPMRAVSSFVIYYSDRAQPADLASFDVIVLDADRHPPLAPMRARGRQVLAYLSLTELGRHRQPFAALQRAGVLLEAHPHWPDAHFVDVRRPEWRSTVLDELVPAIVARGFTGLFLDTLDDIELFERDRPAEAPAIRLAAVDLVKDIRRRYPQLVLMVNRGYALMDDLARTIDLLLGESVVASFDPATKAYRRVSPSDVRWQLDALRRAHATNPSLRLLTLDYWDPADRAGIREIYRRQRANGFVPYVATPALDAIVGEPR